jgi:hypothetical protein
MLRQTKKDCGVCNVPWLRKRIPDFREAPELMVPSAAVQFAMAMSNAAGGLLEATRHTAGDASIATARLEIQDNISGAKSSRPCLSKKIAGLPSRTTDGVHGGGT